MPGLPRMFVNSGVVQPYSAQIGCVTGSPHCPAYGAGGAAACADAGQTATSNDKRKNFFTTPTLDTRERRGQTPGHVPVSDPVGYSLSSGVSTSGTSSASMSDLG